MRIAVYGGSFDPPHMGHQFTCLYVLQCHPIDQIWLVPSWNHPFEKKQTQFKHRMDMCHALANPFCEKVVVSDVESHMGGEGRTLFVLKKLMQEHPQHDFSLIVGADNLAIKDSWYCWKEIETLVPIIEIGRFGYPAIANSIDLPDISSTSVREMIAAGESVVHLLPRGVKQVIDQNMLYE